MLIYALDRDEGYAALSKDETKRKKRCEKKVFDNFMRKRFSRLTNRRRICQQDISNYEYHGQRPGSDGEEVNRVERGREIIFTVLWDKTFLKGRNKKRQTNVHISDTINN